MPIRIGAVVVFAGKLGTEIYSFCPNKLPITAVGSNHKPVVNVFWLNAPIQINPLNETAELNKKNTMAVALCSLASIVIFIKYVTNGGPPEEAAVILKPDIAPAQNACRWCNHVRRKSKIISAPATKDIIAIKVFKPDSDIALMKYSEKGTATNMPIHSGAISRILMVVLLRLSRGKVLKKSNRIAMVTAGNGGTIKLRDSAAMIANPNPE